MRYLVGIDVSEGPRLAFDAALRNATTTDYLLLVSIVDPATDDSSSSLNEQQVIEERAIDKLSLLGEVCLRRGVRYSMVVAAENHPGKMLCNIAEEQGIDLLVLGRRHISSLKRVFTASTSKYCMEHASCNVMVVKRPLPAKEEGKVPIPRENTPHQIHNSETLAREYFAHGLLSASLPPKLDQLDSCEVIPPSPSPSPSPPSSKTELAHQLQEAEWHDYLKEQQLKKEESRKNLELTKLMEEKERKLRTDEVENATVGEREERAQLLQHVKNLEEEERQSRISGDYVNKWTERYNKNRELFDGRCKWMPINDETQEINSYNSMEERLRRLRKVKIEEEIERRRRIQEMNNRIKEEKAQQTKASKLDLDKVRMLEEDERQRRIKHEKKKNMREAIKESVKSYRDLQLVKELEEGERRRRIAEMGHEGNSVVRDNTELEKVKQMEEEKIGRSECEESERKDILEAVKCLEEAGRLKRMRRDSRTLGGVASV